MAGNGDSQVTGKDEANLTNAQMPPVEDMPEVNSTPASPDFRAILASAPSVEEVLGKPDVYRAWLAKAKEALNG